MRRIPRRTFIADLGRGAIVLASVTMTGCWPGPTTGARGPATPGAAATPRSAAHSPGAAAAARSTWSRVRLGHVSAYVYVRHGEAAIVDTGVPGSADEIGYALGAAGLDWSGVGHVILTHRHTDHVGSASDVLARAPGATAYAGAEDIDAIELATPLHAAADGDRIFGLTIVTTPGHTPGSISVFDRIGGVMAAGDALATEGGRPIMPSVRFVADEKVARASVAKLGAMTFETLLVGHGEPIEGDAPAKIATLLTIG